MRGYLKTLSFVVRLQPKRTTVGKSKDSDVCLQNGGVEDHHALIDWCEAERCFVLSDLNSAHGTYVNDCRIHNAAVRLTPGDQLHFGYGGSTYQLAVDSPPSPLPWLSALSPAPPVCVWPDFGPAVTPHPPGRPRPASAGAKRSVPGRGCSEPPRRPHRPGSWAGNTGRRPSVRSMTSSVSAQTMQRLLQEKEENLVRLQTEVRRLAELEGECEGKDRVIAGLQDEVAVLRLRLSQNLAEPEVRQRLSSLEADVSHKKEELQQLKEQMLDLQRTSEEETSQALADRDQRICSLRGQVEKLRRDSNTSAGLIDSLQRDLAAREKQALKLASEVDKLRQQVRHKDAQLSACSGKLTKLKENQWSQEERLARDREVTSLKESVQKLEESLRDRQMELMQQITERDSITHSLQQKTQEHASLQMEVESLRQQQQSSAQIEQKNQTELEQSRTQLESFRSEIMKAANITQDTADQQVVEQLRELVKQREGVKRRVQELEQEQKEVSEAQREVAEHTERLRTRLQKLQSRVQRACTVEEVQREISSLKEANVCPTLGWVQTHTLTMLTTLLRLLQDITLTLQDMGTDASEVTGGVTGAMRTFCQQYQESQSELRNLKAQTQRLQEAESKARDLQRHLVSAREQLEEEKRQVTKGQSSEVGKLKLQLEDVSADLESAKRAEAALREETQSQKEALNSKLEVAKRRETQLKRRLEEGEQREEEWRERMREGEKREAEWKKRTEEAERTGAEEERERYRLQEAEFREQVRQHAYTIVAMEQRLSAANQSLMEAKAERDSLREQLRESQGGLEESTAVAEPDAAAAGQLEQELSSLSGAPSVQQSEPARPQLTAGGGLPPGPGHNASALRSSLAASQQEVSSQGEVISSLTCDLAHAHARISDMTGELSEEQKMELERHRVLQVEQKMELSVLTQKLALMSQLVEQKDGELKMMKEKMKHTEERLKKSGQAEAKKREQIQDQHGLVTPGVIQLQQEPLSEMRTRMRALEQRWPIKLLNQQGEPEKHSQAKTQKLQSSTKHQGSISLSCGFALPEALSEIALERTARLDMSDALDTSERTYVELARALCEALELSTGQLSGCAPIRHLPPGERERLASLRQTDLELLRTRLALLHSQGQRKELQLQENQREMETLRQAVQQGGAVGGRLEAALQELQAQREESALLREALQEALSQPDQHRGPHQPRHRNTAARGRQVTGAASQERKGGRVPSHTCVSRDSQDKAAKRRASPQARLRKRDYEVEMLKKELEEKQLELQSQAAQLALAQAQLRQPLPGEAHGPEPLTEPQPAQPQP